MNTNTMKICHVIFNHSVYDGRIYHKELLSLAAAGYQCSLAVPRLNRITLGRRKDVSLDSVPGLETGGISLLPYTYRRKLPKLLGIRQRACLNSLVRCLLKADADIYHFHEDGVCMEAAVKLKQLRPDKKIVFDFHELHLHQFRENHHKMMNLDNYISTENKLLKTADLFVAISDFLNDYYQTLTDVPIRTIMNCQSRDIMQDIIPKVDPETFWVVHEGTLVFNRGLECMIEMARHLKNPDVRILLVGKMGKAESRYFKKKTREYGVQDRFKVVGLVPYTDVAGYLAGARVGLHFVKAKNAQTGLSNKFFNYLRFGLPIISLPNVAADPLIKKYELGFTGSEEKPEALAERIEMLARDTGEYDRIHRNVLSLFKQKYNWENMAEQLVQAYRGLFK